MTAAAALSTVPAVPNRDAITLRGMRFHTLVGILPHEQELPQPLEVDLTVWTSRGGADEGVVDYRTLYELVARAVGAQVGFLEDLAATVAERALEIPRVHRARAAVRKPHVPLPGPLACAEVVAERERGA